MLRLLFVLHFAVVIEEIGVYIIHHIYFPLIRCLFWICFFPSLIQLPLGRTHNGSMSYDKMLKEGWLTQAVNGTSTPNAGTCPANQECPAGIVTMPDGLHGGLVDVTQKAARDYAWSMIEDGCGCACFVSVLSFVIRYSIISILVLIVFFFFPFLCLL